MDVIVLITKICDYCKCEYSIPESQSLRSKYCSDKCFRLSRRARFHVECMHCGKDFEIPRYKYVKIVSGEQAKVYCSKQCRIENEKHYIDKIKEEFSKKNYILLSNEYISAKEKLVYICELHKEKGEQLITYSNFKSGYGCKFCGRNKTANCRRNSFEKVKELFDAKGLILLPQEYRNSAQKLKYICKKHIKNGIQEMSCSNVIKNGCPLCKQSKGELKIKEYLDLNEIKYIPQKEYDNLVGIGGRKLSYDFYLPDYNLLIEYQGEYHDGTVRNQTLEKFERQKEHDKRKFEFAVANKIGFLEIWYYDFDKIENILSKEI